MTLFLRQEDFDEEILGGSDAATRALSVTTVETDFVESVYERLASVYDLIFGLSLHRGRLTAIRRMGIRQGDRVLEVGLGTGINITLYPRCCEVTGVDLSDSMLEKARARIARSGVSNVRLVQMDAARLQFPDHSFDIVYAPYLISVVPDPVQVASEMCRVCRPGGRIILLNHFRSSNPLFSRIERILSPMTVHIGFRSDVDLPAFLAQAGLEPTSIEKVNIPKIWSLITCVKQ